MFQFGGGQLYVDPASDVPVETPLERVTFTPAVPTTFRMLPSASPPFHNVTRDGYRGTVTGRVNSENFNSIIQSTVHDSLVLDPDRLDGETLDRLRLSLESLIRRKEKEEGKRIEAVEVVSTQKKRIINL